MARSRAHRRVVKGALAEGARFCLLRLWIPRGLQRHGGALRSWVRRQVSPRRLVRLVRGGRGAGIVESGVKIRRSAHSFRLTLRQILPSTEEGRYAPGLQRRDFIRGVAVAGAVASAGALSERPALAEMAADH